MVGFSDIMFTVYAMNTEEVTCAAFVVTIP